MPEPEQSTLKTPDDGADTPPLLQQAVAAPSQFEAQISAE